MLDEDESVRDEYVCDNCLQPRNTLYVGWFRTAAAFNPFAAGTASASLIQQRQMCKACAELAIKTGLACATELPDNRKA